MIPQLASVKFNTTPLHTFAPFTHSTPSPTNSTRKIRRLLRLSQEPQRFVLSYSPMRGTENELAVNSRSMLQIMQAFASHVEVPATHLKDHSAWPSVENASSPEGRQQGVRIHSGKDKPSGAFAAVRYLDYWFWIDNGDLVSKRALTVVMFFFTLSETGAEEKFAVDHHPGSITRHSTR
jgi:hypothetical protein